MQDIIHLLQQVHQEHSTCQWKKER